MVSEAVNDAFAWSVGEPRFISSDVWASVVKQLPESMDEDDRKKWTQLRDDDGGLIDFVVTSCPEYSLRSIKAGNRYYELNELYEKFPVSTN